MWPGTPRIPMGAKPWGLNQSSFPVSRFFDPLENPVNFFQKKPLENPTRLELFETLFILSLLWLIKYTSRGRTPRGKTPEK